MYLKEINKRRNIMSTTTNWLPAGHAALYNLATRVKEYILSADNRDRMGFGSVTPLGNWFDQVFMPAYYSYSAIMTQWLDEAHRTSGVIATLKTEEEAFTPVFRRLYSALLKDNPLVSGTDLSNMGLPPRHTGGSPRHPAPDTEVAVVASTPGHGRITLDYYNEGSESKAKPFGVHGAELVYKISDTQVTDHDELIHSLFDTDSPFHLTFPDSQRGKTLYYSLRWEGTAGLKGPWNSIKEIVIP
jgi:hypothetical protein